MTAPVIALAAYLAVVVPLLVCAAVTDWRNTRPTSRLTHDIPLNLAPTAPMVSLPADRGERWATLSPHPSTATPTVPGLRLERIKRRIHGPGPLAAHIRARTTGPLEWVWRELDPWRAPVLPAAGPWAARLAARGAL